MANAGDNSDGRASTSTSRSLLARLRVNDPVAWERVLDLYAPLVWHWCRRMNVSRQDAADVFQEVFRSVAEHIATFQKQRPQDTFRGWLRTITRNKVLDYFRREEHHTAAAGGSAANVRLAQVPQADWEAEDRDERTVERQVLHRALQAIEAEFEGRTWQAFWLVVVDGRPAAEVAEKLGMTPGAVRVAKSRVLNRLRRELGDLTP